MTCWFFGICYVAKCTVYLVYCFISLRFLTDCRSLRYCFACLLSTFISLFQIWVFFIRFARFTYVSTVQSIISFRLVYADDCSCLRVYVCVEEFCCRWKLNHLARTHYRHTQWQHCAFHFKPIDTRENPCMHTHSHAHSLTHIHVRWETISCRAFVVFIRVVFFITFIFNVLIASQRHIHKRVNEWTNEWMCPYACECLCVRTVCSFYCCQFCCPFHSLAIRISNICVRRSKYIIIYIMITFARCWCAYACMYLCICVCNDFFSQYSLIRIQFHIYIPVDITCGSGFTFRYFFSFASG